MSDPADLVCVGALAGAFGVRGEVRLKSFCAEPEAVAGYGPLSAGETGAEITLRLTRAIPGGFAARIEGVASREAAEALKGTRLYVARARLPAPPGDEFYHSDLLGMEVADTGGTPLGRVKAVQDFGAGDLLEIQPASGATFLLPFTRAIFPTVDLARRRIVADPPQGAVPGAQDD